MCISQTKNVNCDVKAKSDIWSIAGDAYTYAYPLVVMHATKLNSTNAETPTQQKAPVNQFIHSKKLAGAQSKFVVTPNVDTVYTQAYLDLSGDAMVFYKPAADRFYSVELLDAYTNSARILGTAGDTQAGRAYLLTGPGFTGETPGALERVALPTNEIWLLSRIVVNDEADFENVYALQNEMALEPLSAYLSDEPYLAPRGVFDPANVFVPIDYVSGLSAQQFFDIANEQMAKNPPPAADGPMLEKLAQINVGPGLRFDASILNDDGQRWEQMLLTLHDRWSERSAAFIERMGCWDFWGEPIAEFGAEYDFRALVAWGGLGANPVSVAIYPKADADSSGEQLNGIKSYILHFSQTPPVLEYGFWSVTAYGEDNFLIGNEIGRYAINDRSAAKYNEDGSLDIYIQQKPPESKELQGNWLPVCGEPFHLFLRVYLPADSIFNREWEAPSITAV